MESKDISMKAKLKSVMDSDIASITATGKPVQLDRELKEYFKTETLSHELISSKLGEGAALTWEDNRQLAQRVNGATEGMEGLPQSAIMDRLNRLVPQGGEPDFIRRQAVSEAASKQATKIINDRLADPAAAADKQPEVAALLEKIHADPTDMQAAKDLTVARMKAQEYLGIPDRMRTPITLNEARQIANPLLDKANANPALAAKTIVDSVKAITGGDADLAHRALSTVLQVKDVSKEQAESTASALAAANRPVAQGDAPAQPKKLTGFDPTQPYTGSDGIPSYYPPPPGPSDNYADNPDVGNPFVPGAKMLPAEHIKMLRQNPGLSSEFDTTHGRGAAQWVFDNQPQANSTQGFDESGMAGAGADPYASPDTPDNGFE